MNDNLPASTRETSWFPAALATVLLLGSCGPAGTATGPTGLDLARRLAGEGRLQEAEVEIGRLLEGTQDPELRRKALEKRGCVRVERGRARKALLDLAKAGPLAAEGMVCRGKAYALTAQHREALADLLPMIEADKADAESTRIAIASAMSIRDLDTAARLAAAASQRFPDDTTIQILWAKAQAVAGQPEAAFATLGKLEKSDRNNPEVFFVKGNVLWAQQRLPEAIHSYREALELNPQFPEAMRNLGVTLIQSAQYDEAAKLLVGALKWMSDDVGLMNNLGVALASANRLDEAKAVFEKAIAISAGNPHLLNNLADVYLREGDVAKAMAIVRQLVDSGDERDNALKVKKDLTALETLLKVLCTTSRKEAIDQVRQQFATNQWSDDDAKASLKTILSDTRYTRLIETAEQSCSKK